MKDEYYKETVTKIIISVVVFITLIGGICVYMFWPTESDEIDYDETEIVDEESEEENIETDDSIEENAVEENTLNDSRIVEQYVSNTINNV